MLQKLTFTTHKKHEVIDITKILNDLLQKNGFYEGVCFLFCTQTTCALTTVDMEDGAGEEDYVAAYEALMPKLPYKHPHDPGHFGEHLMSTTIGTSFFIPVQSASMVLGLNQKVALIEFSGPSERHVTLNFIKGAEQGQF